VQWEEIRMNFLFLWIVKFSSWWRVNKVSVKKNCRKLIFWFLKPIWYKKELIWKGKGQIKIVAFFLKKKSFRVAKKIFFFKIHYISQNILIIHELFRSVDSHFTAWCFFSLSLITTRWCHIIPIGKHLAKMTIVKQLTCILAYSNDWHSIIPTFSAK